MLIRSLKLYFYCFKRKKSNSLLYSMVTSLVETEIVDGDGNFRSHMPSNSKFYEMIAAYTLLIG